MPERNSKQNLVSSDRRRIIAGLGTMAAASWLPLRISAQDEKREAEILIIGGGMAGCATALQLARHGRDVMLLERGEIASEASGQNMGGLGGPGWGHMPDLQSHLRMGSLEIFKELQNDLGYDMEYRLSGSVSAIHTEEQYEYQQDQVQAQNSRGFDGQILTPREARSIEPEVSLELAGYVYLPRRGQADPIKSTRAFAHAAQSAGAIINTGHNVTSISVRGNGGYSVTTNTAEFNCQTLVIATGAWSDPVGQMLGLRIPVIPIRGQMWATEKLPPRVFHDISSAESGLAWSKDNGADESTPPNLSHKDGRRVTRHLYGRQRKNGEIIFGGDREDVGYNMTPDPDGINVNKTHATEILPLLADLPIAKTWAGMMPFSLDGAPIIGKIPQRENLFIVGGLSSSGFGRGPMAGKLAADYIHTGQMPPLLADADPARCVTEAE